MGREERIGLGRVKISKRLKNEERIEQLGTETPSSQQPTTAVKHLQPQREKKLLKCAGLVDMMFFFI